MTISTRFGSEVEIVAYCGKHKPEGFAGRLVLVRTKRKSDGKVRHYFMGALKSEGGLPEIEAAVKDAPEIVMTGEELKLALAEAR